MIPADQNRDLPILIIGFNRPDLVGSLIKELREIRPNKVFVAIDGPRDRNDRDNLDVILSREMVREIDWDCVVLTNFASTNFGAGYWPKKAVDWALSLEPKILVLEDDVRIAKSFYFLAQILLERYATKDNIFAVCAWNLVNTTNKTAEVSYLTTKYFSGGGGWATWRSKWEKFNDALGDTSNIFFSTLLKENNFNILMALYYSYNFRKNRSKSKFSWDYEIMKYIFKNGLTTILPTINMSENIGVGPKATHTYHLPIYKKSEIDVTQVRSPSLGLVFEGFEKKYRRIRLSLFLRAGIMKLLISIKKRYA